VDAGWCVTFFNRAAEKITGINRADALGRRCCDVFRASVCEHACVLKQTLATGRPVVNKVVYIVDACGEKIPISISTAVLKDDRGKVIGGVESFRDLRLVEELHRELQQQNSFSEIIGRSASMRQIFEILPQIAESDSTVLIEGASGTGKELFARAIHNLSPRRDKKFVAINCGALPDTLLESELFGYKAGAFTDARRDKPGRFALADGGTILLDEIGDISTAMQTRLLRVLQERVYEPLGGIEPVKCNVRVIAATNKSLGKLVEQGRFREDLFYRIHVVGLRIPPLRARVEDIPQIFEHYLHRFAGKAGRNASLTQAAKELLKTYAWPGNIRQLRNIAEVVAYGETESVDAVQISEVLGEQAQTATASSYITIPESKSLKQMESEIIRNLLSKHTSDEVCTRLGISRVTLWRKMKNMPV
jgi:PAS domain S-box-containing protein